MEILVLDVERLHSVDQPTQFKGIILPDRSFSHALKGFTEEYRRTINHVRDFALRNQTPTSNEKIYYFHGRRQIGEERIAEYFKSKGYEIIRPEKLTFDEQLNILINCKSFAATVGSASHNSVFLPDNSEVILINRLANGFYFFQRAIDQVHEQNLHYVDSTLSIFYTRNGPFFYMLSKQLKDFFSDEFSKYDEADFKNFLQYIKNSLEKGLTVKTGSKNYYAKILADFIDQLKQHEDLIKAFNMPPHWETFQLPLTYQTHVAKKGWDSWKYEEQISNDIEQQRQIEAIKINSPTHKVYYSVYYNDKEDWSAEVTNSEQAGTTGKSKAIYGIKIRLDEAGAKEFNILYRVHKFDGTWTDWAKNGEAIYSHGQKLNAVQIKLETKT